MKYLGLWSPWLRNSFWKICKTLRPPSYILNVLSLNSVRLPDFVISRRIISHIFGARYLNALNHNSLCLQGLVWNQFGNADYNLYLLDWKFQTFNELISYFLLSTILYLTIEYFYGGLIESYLSLEDLQMLIHYRYKRF